MLPYPCQRRPELFFDTYGHALELARELCAACPIRRSGGSFVRGALMPQHSMAMPLPRESRGALMG